MILLTGTAGFIGSNVLQMLNDKGLQDIIIVDDFAVASKKNNWEGKKFAQTIDRNILFEALAKENFPISKIIHIGAKTDTTLMDTEIFEVLNVSYSKKLWQYAVAKQIPFVYASSAATYGAGELGYDDVESKIANLHPLNPYGHSKNDFDKWVLLQSEVPPHWYGLKFFNVYGPNEYHKGRMASVIFHAYNQIKQNGTVNLFQSHKPEYQDGGQMRDFVYVKDVCAVINYLITEQPASGIYNLGSGLARTFNDLIAAIFSALQLPTKINYIPTPIDIRESYQYYTQANMAKLIATGYKNEFYTLENGVADYVNNYLLHYKYA